MNKLFLLVVGFAFSMSNISYAGDAKAGAVKAATCVACHGADGNSMAPNFPNLAGQGEPYIIKQLTDLKANKTRKDATMIGMVAALTPIDMENIAAFFSAQKLKIKPIPMSDAIKKGQDIYRGGITGVNIPACIGCHGPKGEGNPGAKYPALSGQNQVYSLKQLKDFQSGARFNDEKSVMRDVVKRMTVDEMQAVTSYIAGLK